MNHFMKILWLCSLVSSAFTQDLDQLYSYVSAKIAETNSYQTPINNERLFKTNNSTIYDFGQYDFIIVGAGAAGCVLANRLTEISKWNVLLLEAGGETNAFSDIPRYSNALKQTDMNWGYLTTPQKTCCQGMNNNQCIYPRGKVIGGSTTINAAIYARGSASDYNHWAAMGNLGWSYNHILKYFKKSEHVALKSYDINYHGKNGELYVNQTTPPSIVSKYYIDANKEKHLKEIDYNGRRQLGVSRIQFNQKDRVHQNAAHAFLDGIKTRSNLKIVLNAGVNKILLKGKKATGVTFVLNGTIYKATAGKEVILSAGAINSPQLLILSGVGPKTDLENLNIPVRNDLPAVGRNMQDHPLFGNLYFRTNLSSPVLSLKENLANYLEGKAPFTNGNGLENIAFINSDHITTGELDIEFLTFAPPLGVPAKNLQNLQDDVAKVFSEYNTSTDLGVCIALMKPMSKGKVTLQSNNIVDFPLIDINYFSDANNNDLETMYKGIKYILSLADTKAFKSINATFVAKQPRCEHLKDKDREYWYCALRHMAVTEFHPAGTTRMGLSKRNSVVNTNCVVHEYKNFRVVDAGVMPEITRGHLMAAVYMIAERISDEIKKAHRVI
ncbi:glucose dehydrogenase [FAD, quinone]-like [Diabrotica virgifera virgifera]|uniref:Glucose-methanol-choline oxidoreductase N-terminal domain-containing protein n=2 Tax=Diabrotica virgifera virgifera TaxID=50390 RepID=A0ABM5KVS7_DIAVI|nr:glucose dehydrogenase [FAD, quinone]-like [Diabrotica virgifera virgifera]